MDPAGWHEGSRGFVSFLADQEMIAPDRSLLEDPRNAQRLASWIHDEDWQLLRNRTAYPRAWVVHRARFTKPIRGLTFEDRGEMMQEILFANDAFWFDYYPGWTLQIDGKSAPILRTNRLMRGAAVAAGTHRLVYRYDPLSFRLGGLVSLLSIALGVGFGVRASIQDREAAIGPGGEYPVTVGNDLENAR